MLACYGRVIYVFVSQSIEHTATAHAKELMSADK